MYDESNESEREEARIHKGVRATSLRSPDGAVAPDTGGGGWDSHQVPDLVLLDDGVEVERSEELTLNASDETLVDHPESVHVVQVLVVSAPLCIFRCLAWYARH